MIMAMVLQRRRGVGEDAELFRRSWRVSRCPRDRGRRTGAVGRVFVSGGQGRLSLMMASSTGRAPAREHVWGTPGVGVMLRAGADGEA